VSTKAEKVLWRKLYYQHTGHNRTNWDRILRDFNTVAELHKDLRKQQGIQPTVFHKSKYWLQQFEQEEIRSAQENYPVFLAAVSMQWTGSAAGVQPGLSQSETAQYARMMQLRAQADATATTGGDAGAAAAAAAAAAAGHADTPLNFSHTDSAGAGVTGSTAWQQIWMQQQQQYLSGHGGLGLRGGIGTGPGLGGGIFNTPWGAAACNPAAAVAGDIGGQGRQRSMSKRAAESAQQQQQEQKRPRQYRKQKCQQCWNPRASNQAGGRPGKAAHCKWGQGYCQVPCAVCGQPMDQHAAPCAKPASAD
jgi:hypothetical protein